MKEELLFRKPRTYPQNLYLITVVGRLELSSTGNENVFFHLKCILTCSLTIVPLFAFDQKHWPFCALEIKFCQGVKKKQIKNSQHCDKNTKRDGR